MGLLKVENLETYYGSIKALKGVSIEVGEKEIVCIIGANGAGKTTLLNTISGLLQHKAGNIFFNGMEISNLKPFERVKLGIIQVPEGRKVFAKLTVMENLEMGAYLVKDKKAVKRTMEWVFTLFPRLWERRGQKAGSLSGGEQQMLAIARALMSQPKLLMLDEPSMGLAPIVVEKLFEVIKKIGEEIPILLVEQNAFLSLEISHRGYVLETGNIVLQGTSQELRNNEMVKKAYLGG